MNRSARIAALALLLGACGPGADKTWVADSECGGQLSTDRVGGWFRALREAKSTVDPPESSADGPCLLFLSAGGEHDAARTVIGRGPSAQAAFEDARERLTAIGETRSDWLRIDVPDELHSPGSEVPLTLPRSLYGLASAGPSGPALLPAELVAYRMIDSQGDLRPDHMMDFVDQFPWRFDFPFGFDGFSTKEADWPYRFSTRAWFSDGDEVFELYRGHRQPPPVTRDVLLEAAEQAGDYLLSALHDNGRYVYIWSPRKNSGRDRYNILRHAGTTYSLLELYRQNGDERLLAGASRALEHLGEHVDACPAMQKRLCVVEDGDIKLGGNGLAIIAMVEYQRATGDGRWLGTARALAEFNLQALQEDGAFRASKWRADSGDPYVGFVSVYYPGEAILAWTRLYAMDPDPRWLLAAQSAARYLITVRDRGKTIEDLPHDHWLLYGLNELYGFDRDPLWLQSGLFIARAILAAQTLEPEYRDWHGSFYQPPRSTPSATRSEALVAAWSLAAKEGLHEEQQAIATGLCAAVRFQLQTQFRPETMMFQPDPARVRGGFYRDLEDFEVRIDFVQHNISAMLGLAGILAQTSCAEPGQNQRPSF